MFKNFVFVFSYIFLSPSINAQEFYSISPNLEGEELLVKLVDEFKPNEILNYSDARDTLFSIIDNHNDSLTCVYSGHTIYIDPQLDPTQAAFKDGSSNGINTEHTFPQSMGAGSGNARSDMHHLFPTRTAVNSARSNNEFHDIEDLSTTHWYYLDDNQTQIPDNNIIHLFSENDDLKFEPREDHKGDVARAMFYFYTMYKTEADNASSDFFENQRETLCQWNIADPITQTEQDRSIVISKYQEGKVNPFIFDCTLAAKTYCPNQPCQTTSIYELENKHVLVYPNPTSNTLTVNLASDHKSFELRLLDMNGKLIKKKSSIANSSKFSMDVQSIKPGAYNLQLITENGNAYSKVIIN